MFPSKNKSNLFVSLSLVILAMPGNRNLQHITCDGAYFMKIIILCCTLVISYLLHEPGSMFTLFA
jgi:hypothetical protein